MHVLYMYVCEYTFGAWQPRLQAQQSAGEASIFVPERNSEKSVPFSTEILKSQCPGTTTIVKLLEVGLLNQV